MKATTLNRWLLCVVLTTILAIVAYPLIPSRVYEIPKTDQWLVALVESFSLASGTQQEWVEKSDSIQHIKCEVEDRNILQTCGINFFAGEEVHMGHDLSDFDRVTIKAKYIGEESNVRIFFRNYNPEYSIPGNANSAKFMAININTSEFNSKPGVVIAQKEFVVERWWLAQRKLDRNLLPIEFSNISTFGFDFSQSVKDIGSLEFELNSILFEGAWIKLEHWYLGILGFWMSVIVGVLVYNYFFLVETTRTYSRTIVDLVTDKAELEQRSKKYQELSHLDTLTGILNRSGIHHRLEALVNNGGVESMGLVILDLDNFKSVNDTYGHDVGDQVLSLTAEVIQGSVRDEDIFGRWGGEEFILILPNTGFEGARLKAELLRERLVSFEYVIGRPLVVTASMGATSFKPNESFDQAFKRADVALLQAKSEGRNRVVVAKLLAS